MKLPFNLTGCGGNGYHSYVDSPYDNDDNEIDRTDDLITGESQNDEDFTEYLWMENEEEFDKLEWQRLEEQELMEQCIEIMMEDELENSEMIDDSECVMTVMWPSSQSESHEVYPMPGYHWIEITSTNIENSTLNPLAKEFVPSSANH